MKLIKLFEQFIAEDAKTDYPAGKYFYHYLDKDFKPIGPPKQNLRVNPEPAAYGVDGLSVFVNGHSLQLSPLTGYKLPTFKHRGVFQADFTNNPLLPNPWPEGTTYIKIYTQAEAEAAGVPKPGIADVIDPQKAPGIADVIDPPAQPAVPVNYPQ